MPLGFACFWQVVSEALAWESSTHNILTSWHLSPSYQGWGYSSLVTVSSLGSMQTLFVIVYCQESSENISL